MIKNFIRVIFLLVILFTTSNFGFSQSASSMSDAQILQIMAAANQKGMSQQELSMYAKSKGYSDADISKLMQRANSINNSNTNIGTQNMNGNLAQRQMVQFGSANHVLYQLRG